jgi:hypothetical protein
MTSCESKAIVAEVSLTPRTPTVTGIIDRPDEESLA